ncbi:glycosyltransferase family 4 protein [Kallotenue papyrolyticum]|uniref:glycosyltransferase family 4 protein n=1 Tax=Kallotenue papyrolyticum TaxID=1325125 RepID=UPI00047866BB|nr:glycosyltransferase family 4 protein [Kallotenue papyrolyticum]
MSAEPIALVLPWFGPDTAGGAEAQARQLARALHQAGVDVEVWTTTARDAHAPLQPYYPHGDSEVDGIRVRRFRPNRGAGRHITRRLTHDFPIAELNLLESLTGSDELLDALTHERDRRRWIFFLYAFPTSFWGMQIAGERGYLVACLHDEPYAYHSTTRFLLRTARKVLANSAGERDLIRRLTDLPESRVPVVGEGIELHWRGDGARFRAERRLTGPLIFFAGRRDFTKNWPLLLAYFEEYLARRGPTVTLIAAGPGRLQIAPALREHIIDLGFLDDQTKHDAYAAADIFCNPSLLESFSLVIMEAWLQGTPVLVHGDCAVTVTHCRAAQGGLWFRSYREFEACLDRVIGDRELARQLGAQGQAWVREHCRWEDVARRFIKEVFQ